MTMTTTSSPPPSADAISTTNANTFSCPSALSLGSCIFGIPIRIHYTYFLLLLLELVSSLLTNIYHQGEYPLWILFVFLLYGPILLVTILVHEFGHAITTKRFGGTVDSILVWPLGGFAFCGPTEGEGYSSLINELKVAIAGPATHIPMALLWWAIYIGIVKGEESSGGSLFWPSTTIYLDTLSQSVAGFFQCLSAQSLYMNIILFCFNLLIPAYPLDGGRVYAACLLLLFKLKAITAAKVTSVTAMLISFGMIVYAIINYFSYATTNSELMIGLVGVFVFYQSYELWVAAKNDALAEHAIFGKKCYSDRHEGNSTSRDDSSGNDNRSPSVTNETEIV